MEDDLAVTLEEHRRPLPENALAWGWKEPRSIYLISFFDTVMPGFRFLHFMRDGRDMAFSENQQQLKKHGDAVLSGIPRRKKQLRSIALWSTMNTQAADFGERHMRAGISVSASRISARRPPRPWSESTTSSAHR